VHVAPVILQCSDAIHMQSTNNNSVSGVRAQFFSRPVGIPSGSVRKTIKSESARNQVRKGRPFRHLRILV
jgi:hypothetical protein